MSIFYRFGVEAGDPCNVQMDGAMDMSLGDLKLAIVTQRNINNVTDYDLRVENNQTGKVYLEEDELIPRYLHLHLHLHLNLHSSQTA